MLKVEAYGITDVGRQRSRNEDSFAIVPDRRLYVVADGMGGHGNGHIASRLVVEEVSNFMRSGDSGGDAEAATARLREAVQAAQAKLRSAVRADESLIGMGTTLVSVLVVGDLAIVAHVGDSRVYRWRAGRLERLTRDHSWVDEQVAAGYLSEEQARTHPLKSVVTRALSGEDGVEVDARVLDLREGDRYLICSDGLSNMLSDADLGRQLDAGEALEVTCRALVEEANARGGLDNITVVLLAVRDSGA
jgi:protein phosphatase